MNPSRLVTLLDLLEFKAEPFCRLSSVVGQMLVLLENGIVPDVSAMGGSLGELHREVRRLKFRSVDRQLEKIKEHFTSGHATAASMRPMIVSLYERMMEECGDRFFLAVSAENADYYKQTTPLFGPDAEAKFPQMSEDISESGKCIALDRPTAAVFHLMRVTEIGVQCFGDKLGVTLTSEKNWQNILDEINKTIKAMDHKAAQTKAYAAVSSHLYNVKIAWRNEVMHPKQTYTSDEAMNIFAATKVFICDLASLL